MAQYKQERRNGRWIWVDKNGKEVKLGQGPLGEVGKKLKNLARQGRDMVVYSDKLGPNGMPQTIDEERRRSKLVHGPGGSPSGSGQGQAQQKSGKTSTPKPTPAKPKAKKPEVTKPNPPQTAPKTSSTPAPARRSGSTSSTPKPAPKSAPKPAGKVPASSETYRDGGKGLYQGSKEYRDKVGGSGNPLLNRFRQDMGRDASTGSKTEPKMSKPEDKSRYVASNGKPYKGPAFGSGKAEPKKPASPASPNKSEKGMTLAERMRRRRMGMA